MVSNHRVSVVSRRRESKRPLGHDDAETSPLLHAIAFVRPRIVYLVFCAVVGYAIALLAVGNAIRITRVEVYGVLLLDRQSVVRASNLVGKNPFLIHSSDVERRIVDLGVPLEAHLSYRLPDTAIVNVVEREPVYLWKVDPTLYYVARDGTVLGSTPNENRPVIVVDLDHRPIKVGDKLDPRMLGEADYLIQTLPRVSKLAPRYVFFSRRLGIVVPGPDGMNVAFGDDQNLPAKLQALQPTLDLAVKHTPRPTLVDLQVPQHPYFH